MKSLFITLIVLTAVSQTSFALGESCNIDQDCEMFDCCYNNTCQPENFCRNDESQTVSQDLIDQIANAHAALRKHSQDAGHSQADQEQ